MEFSSALELIRKIPDFPKSGIIFQDITPVLANPEDAKAQALAADFEIMSGQAEAALDRLIKFIATNSGAQRDIARNHLLELFQNFAPTEPILIAARSALSKALF